MSYQVLARKWRPKKFSDAVGQEHITRTLTNSIKSDKISHAYLLTGTRGIGKTTIARIFAKAIRCQNLSPEGEPCLECGSCKSIDSANSLDYIEIDGASNNSVDDIRDLIENVQYLPTEGRYKVYVIDEVHMLSVSAFNALLKTLEEPPEHVVFIFATTDPQKLLGTVLSRCQRFDFKNANIDDLVKHLNMIAKAEGITFENQNIPLELAKQGKGSFRDTLSLMDQVISLSNSETISEEAMLLSLGMAKTKSVTEVISGIFLKDKFRASEAFTQIINENVDLKIFASQILDTLFELLNNLDAEGNTNSEKVDPEALKAVSLVEIMWIYETLFRDFEWSLNTFDPEKATQFVVLKTTLRELVLNNSGDKVELKKKDKLEHAEQQQVVQAPVAPAVIASKVAPQPVQAEESKEEEPQEMSVADVMAMAEQSLTEEGLPEQEVPKQEAAQEEQVEEKKEEPKEEDAEEYEFSWEGFIKYLYKNSRGIAINLERGNLLNREDFGEKGRELIVGFSPECKIFYDYLEEIDHRKIFLDDMATFFKWDSSDVNVSLKMLDDETVEKSNFLNAAQVEEKNIQDEKDALTQDLLNNKYIKEAEKLFNSKVNKVVLNKDTNE